MKNVLRLFAYEFKNIYKQALIFALISTFLFALSISVMCFSTDMVQGYRDYLDKDDYYHTLSMYDVTDFEKIKEVDGVCDYLSAYVYGITEAIENADGGSEFGGTVVTFRPMLQKDEKIGGYHGMAYIFRDELPEEIDEDCVMEEGEIGASYNERNSDGRYSIYLYAKAAEELEVGIGDSVTLNYELTDGLHKEEFTVAGIYQSKDKESSYHYAFFIPFAFVSEHNGKITTHEYDIFDGCCFYLQFNTPSDIMDALPKVRSLGFKELGVGFGGIDEIDLVNAMRYILIAVAVAIVTVTFVVLSNSLTITVNFRKKFMAKLKLLGATTDKVAAMYFVLLILSFIAAFALSVLLSFLLCGYFSTIASVAFEYTVTMKLHWDAVGILFAVGVVLIAARYLLFRLKVKKVSPAEFIKEY